MIFKLIIFLALNFGALALGGLFTSQGVSSDWYLNLSKAPWTPPGWVFGFAWTSIMLCFSFYMAEAWTLIENKKFLITVYTLQWILNVGWNPAFFITIKFSPHYASLAPLLYLSVLCCFSIGSR